MSSRSPSPKNEPYHPADTSSAPVSASASTIQACLSCRKKKIKCDKVYPCGPCSRAAGDCVYDHNGPKRRSRVAGSRRDRQARAKAARLLHEQNGNGTGPGAGPGTAPSSSISPDGMHPYSPTRPTPPRLPPLPPPPPPLPKQQLRDPPILSPSWSTASAPAGRPSTGLGTSHSTPTPFTPSGREASKSITRPPTPDVDVSEHVVLDKTGAIKVRGPTNTLYEASGVPLPKSEAAPTPHPFASAILTASAAIERQKEAQYRSQLLAQGFIEGVPAELALHLIDIHWNRHHFFLLTYRPAFFRDMMTGGPFYSALLFYAILAVSCRYSDRQEVGGGDHAKHSGKAFYEKATLLLMDELGRSSIPTATALLLMGNALMSGGQVDRGWLYTGLGLRMIINLGLHVEGDRITTAKDQRTVEEIEISRRLFWGAFISEKLQSLYLGRPIFMHEMDCHVPKKFFDVYDEDETWKPYPAINPIDFPVMATSSISNFSALCVLSEICEDIMSSFYPVKAVSKSPSALQASQARIRGHLSAWIADLPTKIQFRPWEADAPMVTMHGVVIHTVYYSLIILSERPFVANGHLNQGDDRMGNWAECVAAAEKIAHILRAYGQMYTFRCVPYQICYSTYVASTILVRDATMVGKSKSGFGAKMPNKEHLEMCLKAFREMRVTHPGTKKMEERIRKLMGRLEVNVLTPTFSTPPVGPDNHITSPTSKIQEQLPRIGTIVDQIPENFQARLPQDAVTPMSTGALAPGTAYMDGSDQLAPYSPGMPIDPINGDIDGQLGEPFWISQFQDLNDDILFGVLRDSSWAGG